jgi:hypothetical protein
MSELPDCDRELWRKGEHIATIWDLEPETIEGIVKSAAKASGQRIDWHYVGGRACVRALGDLDSARNSLQEGLKGYERKYRFTTNTDSVLPFPIK